MNLIQIANDVRMLTDQQLQQVMKNPGATPQYIVAAELQRRQKTRDEQQGSPNQGTVVSDLMNKAKRTSQTMPMHEAIPPGMGQPNIQGPPQGMAYGGLVRMKRGGEGPNSGSGEGSGEDDDKLKPISLDDIVRLIAPAISVERPQAPDLTTQDYMAALGPRIAEMEARAKEYEKGALSRALMKAGAGMMASHDPTPLGGIGAGLAGGLDAWTGDKSQTTKDLQNMLQMRGQIAQAQQQAAEALANRRMGLYGHDMGAAIVDAQSKNSYNQLGNKAKVDAAMYNAALPLEQAKLDSARASTDLTRAHGPLVQAQTAETMARAEMLKTPQDAMAAITIGLQKGDENMFKAGLAAATIKYKMDMEQVMAHIGAQLRIAGMNKDLALENSDRQKALASAQARVKEFRKTPQGMTMTDDQEAELVQKYYEQAIRMLGRDKPKQMSGQQINQPEERVYNYQKKQFVK